jgi:hypothetical protein
LLEPVLLSIIACAKKEKVASQWWRSLIGSRR